MRRTLGTLALVLAAALGGLVAAPAVSPASADVTLPTSPFGDPPGANDWNCKPTADRPTPVVIVHGTGGDRASLLERLSANLKSAGFCVFSLDYGNRGLNDIPTSAGQLKTYVERVLAATGAAKVSMVGHSQGGMMPRYYLKNLGGARYVDDLVGIVPSNHGTALTDAGLNPFNVLIGFACTACVQQGAGSPFITALNAGDETPGDVSYTVITTRYDEVVLPYTSAKLSGPNTTNVVLQDVCPFNLAEHLTAPSSKPAIQIAIDALTHDGPARASFRPACA